jgi:hypothetical protein
VGIPSRPQSSNPELKQQMQKDLPVIGQMLADPVFVKLYHDPAFSKAQELDELDEGSRAKLADAVETFSREHPEKAALADLFWLSDLASGSKYQQCIASDDPRLGK